MLRFGFPAGGCSVAWIPPERTVSGTPLVSRNFDFSIQTLSELQGRSPASDEPILAGQPYIIETYPDEGHATLIVCLFDLASGAVDGINDAGLVAALLADDESTNVEPTHGPQAGLREHEICRYLLETCETVDDALEALRVAKQYIRVRPLPLPGRRSSRTGVRVGAQRRPQPREHRLGRRSPSGHQPSPSPLR